MLLIAALANLLIFHYWYTLIAIFARDVLHTGASGYGLLMAAIGLGYTVGPLITAVLPGFTNKGKLLIAATIVWPAVLLIFAVSRIFYFSFALLVFAGIFQGISMALIQSLLLLWSAEEMRGRVSGARAFAVSAAPLGNLLAGAGAGLWGAPITLIASSAIFILLTGLIAIWAFEITKRN
jgi:predicted MFS family arabinose efflux permease